MCQEMSIVNFTPPGTIVPGGNKPIKNTNPIALSVAGIIKACIGKRKGNKNSDLYNVRL